MKNCPLLFVFSFFSIYWNNGKLFATLVIFSFFLWKCHFSIFSFFEHNGKNGKIGAKKYHFFIFPFFYFLGKTGNRKMIQESEIISIFSFSNNSKKIENNKISLGPLTVFFVFLTRTSKLEKWKNYQFSWPFSFFLFLTVL